MRRLRSWKRIYVNWLKFYELERRHKTGSPYWKRLRVRKRVVQQILEIATLYPDWKNIVSKLREEFFKRKGESR